MQCLFKLIATLLTASMHLWQQFPPWLMESVKTSSCGFGGRTPGTGSNGENFDYPASLMFSSSMKIFEGNFEKIIAQVAEDLEKE